MKAITAIYEAGAAATRLIQLDVPAPTVGPRDVLMQVNAVAANPVDYKVRDGMAPGDERILGWDAAGVVRSVGTNVHDFKPGDRVWYAGNIARDGAYAAFHAVDDRIISHMPASLSFEAAAALPLSTITEQVLASHEAALGEQNAFKVSTHYAQDAVLIVNGDTYRGPSEIVLMYAKLIKDLPDAIWRTDVAVIREDLAYVEWACRSATSEVEFGTDTFVVSHGLITRQTASFAIVAVD